MLVDRPLAELQAYRGDVRPAPDLDGFWERTLAAARACPLDVVRADWDVALPHVLAQDIAFRGFDGQVVRGWFLRSRAARGPLPCVVVYEGYGGGRGLPHEWLFWPSAGAAVLVMDTRGQGSGHRAGVTPDVAPPSGPHGPGFLTLGLEDPDRYYYRRVFTDAVRAVEAARSLPEVDADRVVVSGASQGGGIAVAAAGLVPGLAAALVDVPFLCDVLHAVEVTDAHPYQELRLWLRAHRHSRDVAAATLAHVDGVVLAGRATAPALFSVGLMDDVCPPSTVYAAYNAWAGADRAIDVWPYAGHEGGGPDQALSQLAFLRERGVLPA